MKYVDTQFLRAFGIALIVNSHLDHYYPIPYIATGGAIGNSIFFFLSAFGLYLSQQRNHKPFKEWFSGRISRIYPSLWVVIILFMIPLMLISNKQAFTNCTIVIGSFFNPPYWFLQALLVYYLLTYRLMGNNKQNNILGTLLMLVMVYFGCYFTMVDLSQWSVEKGPFDRIHYLMIFIFGIYLAMHNNKIKYTGFNNYLLLIFFVILMYAHKYMMTKGIYHEYQFIQQALMYPIVFYLLKISRSPFILTTLMKSKIIASIIRFLSEHTLEIYMLHETLGHPILKLQLAFPYNIFIFLSMSLIFAAIVKKLADRFRNAILL